LCSKQEREGRQWTRHGCCSALGHAGPVTQYPL
jgi:hypothetical protein